MSSETIVELRDAQLQCIDSHTGKLVIEKLKRKYGLNLTVDVEKREVVLKGPCEEDVELAAEVFEAMDLERGETGLCSKVEVPAERAGYVTGTGGLSLLKIEDEFKTFIIKHEQFFLVFSSSKRARVASVLRIKHLVEHLEQGHYSKDIEECSPTTSGVDFAYFKLNDASRGIKTIRHNTKSNYNTASGGIIEQLGDYVVIWGDREQRQLAEFYCQFFITGKALELTLDEATERIDAYVLSIPSPVRLFGIDERTGTVCLAIEAEGKHYVAILANSLKARTKAKLEIMNLVEEKSRGEFTKNVENHKSDEAWGEDTFRLEKEERTYVFNRSDVISNASGCIVRVVGMVVYFVGSREERENGRRYVKWLLLMKERSLILSSEDSELSAMLPIFHRKKDVLNRSYEQAMKRIERVYQCFVFLAYDAADNYAEKLFIAGHDANLRRVVALEELPRLRTDQDTQDKLHTGKRGRDSQRPGGNDWKRPRH